MISSDKEQREEVERIAWVIWSEINNIMFRMQNSRNKVLRDLFDILEGELEAAANLFIELQDVKYLYEDVFGR